MTRDKSNSPINFTAGVAMEDLKHFTVICYDLLALTLFDFVIARESLIGNNVDQMLLPGPDTHALRHFMIPPSITHFLMDQW